MSPAAITRRAFSGGVAAVALSSCGSRRNDRLTWWAIGQEGEHAPQLVSAFERRTGVTVDVQALPWTAAHQKMVTGFVGNALPDVLMVKNGWLPELVALGALAAVPAGSPLLGDYFPGALHSVTVGAQVFAVPWVVDGWMQFYRTDRLAAVGYRSPPENRDTWWTMAHALKRRFPDSYPTLHLLNWPEPLFTFAAQQPDPLLRNRNSAANFASPGFQDVLRFYAAIYWEGLSPTILGTEVGDSLLAFRRGRFAILPSNAETVADLTSASLGMPRSLWSVTRTPGLHSAACGLADGYSLAVPVSSTRAHDAFALIAHLCTPASALLLNGLTGDLPASRAPWQSAQLKNDTVAQQFSQAVALSVAPPAVPEWQQIVTEVQGIAERYVRRQFTLARATEEMDRRVDVILAKRRALLNSGLIS